MHIFETKLYDIDKCTKLNKNLWSNQSIMLDFIKIACSNEPITIQCVIDEMCMHAHVHE